MTKSRLTLIIDGNWLMMSRLGVLNGRYADERTLMKELKLMMIKSINIVIRTFPMIDNIIFVSDGGSWRKDVSIPEYMKTISGDVVEYKGNREQTVDINWDMVFEEFNGFIDELQKSGIAAFHEPGIEGDDWCWYWSRQLNNNGTNVIIWTKDRDITQLVKTDSNGCFTIVWNKTDGVFISEEDDLTSFLLNPIYQQNDSILKDVINHSTKSVITSPQQIQIDKIIRGDKGDNIFPIMTKVTNGTSGRVYSVNKKNLPESLNIYDIDAVRCWVNEVMSMKSYAGKVKEPVEQIIDHFIYNRKLVVLDKPSYPEYILDIFNKYDNWFDEHDIQTNIHLDDSAVSSTESVLTAQHHNLTDVLNEI